MLSESDVLNAVQRRVQEQAATSELALPDTVEITWLSLLEGETVRCIETRKEGRREHFGSIDLSSRPVYDVLSDYHVAPPKSPEERLTLKLVRRGTAADESCSCSNGKVSCPRCSGRGDLLCEETMICPACRGVDSCLRCDITETKNRKLPEGRGSVDERGLCRRCGERDVACTTCYGRRRVTCSQCGGRGLRSCPDCNRAGTQDHDKCKGAGRIVTWTEGIVSRTPEKDTVRKPEAGVPDRVRKAAHESGHWHTMRLNDDQPVPTEATSEFRRAVQPYLTPSKGEIARQATFQHLKLARVVASQHPHRVYYVIPTASSPRVVILPSQRRLWQIAAAVLGALVVLITLLQLLS
ncbi:hypothetical protein NGF19_23710 [Streptomyces sp. RY43-2]|uniref:Uncharacterized protein n=1 Tax=Streptomyces macrolidinus TaxID=2952607 RepID=A0ABT0ZJL8_9ACTN|nr:hypothetical protein [Streptomyces macrolidinus]MCN9243751.1 hypothetical protein [Streptomyces macrolidinus]